MLNSYVFAIVGASNVPQVESTQQGQDIDRSPSGGSIGRNTSGSNLAGDNGDSHKVSLYSLPNQRH